MISEYMPTIGLVVITLAGYLAYGVETAMAGMLGYTFGVMITIVYDSINDT